MAEQIDMKIYGRKQNGNSKLLLLDETTFVADPQSLRELASFLYQCADGIEENEETWEREEYEGDSSFSGPRIIVFNSSAVEDD